MIAKLQDATAMLWGALDSHERALLLYLAACIAGLVLLGLRGPRPAPVIVELHHRQH